MFRVVLMHISMYDLMLLFARQRGSALDDGSHEEHSTNVSAVGDVLRMCWRCYCIC